ncbi:forkhead box protein unc-130-like [Liolophura sinensis]|uniref:forkhead box protein unc-130-like n=1 Tax=Liolophura sinensis TaxID=3198878 RepID=UPI00315986BE
MLTFSIDDLMGNNISRSRQAATFNTSFGETQLSSPKSETESMFSSSSSSSPETESIAQILLSLDKQAKTAFPSNNCASSRKEEKPEHSYIALISMAILQSPERKLILADIYQYIMDNFPYYNNREKAWRNSVRHNLSLNECFMKNGRADNGKGNYWSIHPSCIEDFAKGDFRRRQARRRARKITKEVNMGYCSPLKYGYDMGYVPMTSSPMAYHPYLGTAACMMWSPPQIPSPHCYYLGTGNYPQNFSPPKFTHSPICSPISLGQYQHPTTENFTAVS